MRLLQMSLAGGVMIVVITVLRALAINKVPKKTFLLLWAAALLRLLLPKASEVSAGRIATSIMGKLSSELSSTEKVRVSW